MRSLRVIQVSLLRNLPTIRLSLERFRRYYPGVFISVICPDRDCEAFRNGIAGDDIEFISESSILSLSEFREIALKELASSDYSSKIVPRLSWYYQQVLKIAFLIDTVEKDSRPVLSWDADTTPLRRLKFFDGDHTVMYGSADEFHEPYFATAKVILGELPTKYLSSTIQFIGLSVSEKKHLVDRLNHFSPKSAHLTTAQWIAQVVMRGVVLANPAYNDSMISEQDLLGLSHLLSMPSKQIPILQLRWGIEGRLTKAQSLIAGLLGFHHVTYETPAEQHQKIQSWKGFKVLCSEAMQRYRQSRITV